MKIGGVGNTEAGVPSIEVIPGQEKKGFGISTSLEGKAMETGSVTLTGPRVKSLIDQKGHAVSEEDLPELLHRTKGKGNRRIAADGVVISFMRGQHRTIYIPGPQSGSIWELDPKSD